MKTIVAALLTGLLLVLGAIAYDLHQIARATGALTGVGAYAVHTTREQRVKSAVDAADDAMAEAEAIAKTPRSASPKTVLHR